MSAQTTSLPVSARQAPATRPTYPVPTTAIFIGCDPWVAESQDADRADGSHEKCQLTRPRAGSLGAGSPELEELVPQQGGPLEVQRPGCLLHLLLENFHVLLEVDLVRIGRGRLCDAGGRQTGVGHPGGEF